MTPRQIVETDRSLDYLLPLVVLILLLLLG